MPAVRCDPELASPPRPPILARPVAYEWESSNEPHAGHACRPQLAVAAPSPRAGDHRMTLSLAGSQSGIGHTVMEEDSFPIDPTAAGSRSTAWSEDRTMIAVRGILTLVPQAERRRLIAEDANRFDGLTIFQPDEKEAFLAFLAARLPNPSHALTFCYMNQALIRAHSGAEAFVGPGDRTIRARIDRTLRDRIEHEVWGRIEREAWQCIERAVRGRVEKGQHATLVWFHADPDAVFGALDGAAPPPVGEPAYPRLFAPGLRHLWRARTAEEAALWARLPTDDIAPESIERLLAEGAIKYAE